MDLFWQKCAEVKLPVNFHIADHTPAWQPDDEHQDDVLEAVYNGNTKGCQNGRSRRFRAQRGFALRKLPSGFNIFDSTELYPVTPKIY